MVRATQISVTDLMSSGGGTRWLWVSTRRLRLRPMATGDHGATALRSRRLFIFVLLRRVSLSLKFPVSNIREYMAVAISTPLPMGFPCCLLSSSYSDSPDHFPPNHPTPHPPAC